MNHPIRLSFALAVTVALLGAQPVDDFRLMHMESIAGIKVDMAKDKALALVHGQARAGRMEKWEADGMFHQRVVFPAQGLTLMMASESKHSPQTVESISITAPGTSQTGRGIRIGSTLEQVRTAYQQDYNKEDSVAGSTFVAGSTYGGLTFQFENGRVTRMFLGAAAE